MRTRRALITSLAFLAFFCAFAQTAPELKVKAKMNFDLGGDGERTPLSMCKSGPRGVVVFRGYDASKGPEKFIDIPPKLEQYERDKMTLLRTLDPNMKGSKWKIALEAVEPMGGKLMMIGTSTDTLDGAVQVLVAQLDADLTKVNGPFTQICRFEHMRKPPKKFRTTENGIPHGMKTALSPDSTKLLAWTSELVGEEVHAKHVFIALDKDMQLLWYELVKSPTEATRTDVLAAAIDNDGRATAVVKSTFGEIKYRNGENSFTSKVVQITEDGVKEMDWAPGAGQYAVDAMMISRADGSIACAGVYGESENKKKHLTPGIYLATFTAGMDAAPKGTSHEFAIEGNATDLHIDAFVAKSEGYYVVAEHFWLKWPPLPSTATEKSYESIDPIRMHNNVYALNLGGDGGLIWQTRFDRNIKGEDEDAGHVLAGQYEDQLFILMLDHELNLDLRKKSQAMEPKDLRSAITTFTTFDDAGKFKTKTVRTGEYFDAIMGTKLYRINSSEYVAFGAENPGTNKQVPLQLLLVKAAVK
ncbi:MAG: hypothetical protein KA230_00835 [Flavobacteriales bacterium]|nr:hypothetical protein [Flavobacteriales bacterium]